MKEYNVGDLVWWAKADTQQVKNECPVCFGKCHVIVVLGNDEQVEVECDYCGKGYERPKGFLLEYEWIPGIQKIHISAKEVKDSYGGHQVEYRYGGYILKDTDIFDTEAEANIRIQEKIAEHIKEQEARSEHGKEFSTKSYSWHAGYHRKEKKRAEAAVEYHGKKAISMGKLARTAK